ncbi:MAG: metallophosphoesterase family protein [Candidatus Promineofilum sp.]|nr:metallophosphoesterase family protein [Promineifilum sp.]
MRVAIFSDVHGNLSALEIVLADIERQAPDLIVFAGDLCLFGPRPAECLRLVLERQLPSVIGNTDAWLADTSKPPERHPEAVEWTRGQLSAAELARLGRMPFALRLSPTASASDDLLIVHANPRDWNEIVFPSEAEQIERWGKVRQSDAELEPLFGGLEAAVVAYGHLHIPGLRPWRELTLVNVSSVNMPGDGDARAKYALLEWRDGRWTAQHIRLSYDTMAESAAFRESRPPRWEEAVAALEKDGYYYPQQI